MNKRILIVEVALYRIVKGDESQDFFQPCENEAEQDQILNRLIANINDKTALITMPVACDAKALHGKICGIHFG